jgi:hypothetical protein
MNATPQPPWQSIPKFVPGTTNVQEYVQKLKFLAAMWPAEHLPQLAPRAALLVEGTAFKKVARLDPSKLKVANQSGIALLVDAIGGSWGSTELEERYEYFERALYETVQRHDESHDSFLARMEANFVELLSRGTIRLKRYRRMCCCANPPCRPKTKRESCWNTRVNFDTNQWSNLTGFWEASFSVNFNLEGAPTRPRCSV